MKSWHSLPEEILTQIFTTEYLRYGYTLERRTLKKQDLFQCALVCRNWRLPAQRVNYSKLDLKKNECVRLIKCNEDENNFSENARAVLHLFRHFSLSKKQKKEKRLIEQSADSASPQSPGIYVKSLVLDWFLPYPTKTEWKEKLPLLANIFPFMRKLYVWHSNNEFYSVLIDIHNDSKWKLLESIAGPLEEDNIALYNTCALKYKDSLSSLLLCDRTCVRPLSTTAIYSQQYKRLADNLDQFPKLQNLTIKKHTNDGIEAFDDVFQKCPALTTLTIKLYFDTIALSPKYPKMKDLSLITPRTAIQKLKSAFVVRADESLLYIMHKFPKLQSLYINENMGVMFTIDDKYFNDVSISTDTNFTCTVLCKFLLYAISITSCAVNFRVKMSLLANTLIGYAKMLPNKKITQCLKLAARWKFYESFEASHDKNAMVRILTRYNNMDKNVIELSSTGYHCLGNTLPHLDILEKVGAYLLNLEIAPYSAGIDDQMSMDRDSNTFKMKAGYYLDHIFQHCPNLTHLCVRDSELIHCNPHMFENNTITHLTLSFSNIGKDMLSEISARLPSLKHLCLSGCKVKNPFTKEVNRGYLHIDMPHAVLDDIHIDYQFFDCPFIHGKVSTKMGGDKYNRSEFNTETCKYTTDESTRDEYENMVLAASVSSRFYVNCESIKKIKLVARDINRKECPINITV